MLAVGVVTAVTSAITGDVVSGVVALSVLAVELPLELELEHEETISPIQTIMTNQENKFLILSPNNYWN